MKKEFNKEKIVAYEKYTSHALEELKVGYEGNDIILDLLTVQLSNFIFTRMIGEETITKTFARSTFFEWLFRKKRTVLIDVVAKEILKNTPDTDIIYKIEEHEEIK